MSDLELYKILENFDSLDSSVDKLTPVAEDDYYGSSGSNDAFIQSTARDYDIDPAVVAEIYKRFPDTFYDELDKILHSTNDEIRNAADAARRTELAMGTDMEESSGDQSNSMDEILPALGELAGAVARAAGHGGQQLNADLGTGAYDDTYDGNADIDDPDSVGSCSACNGSGHDADYIDCQKCQGSGNESQPLTAGEFDDEDDMGGELDLSMDMDDNGDVRQQRADAAAERIVARVDARVAGEQPMEEDGAEQQGDTGSADRIKDRVQARGGSTPADRITTRVQDRGGPSGEVDESNTQVQKMGNKVRVTTDGNTTEFDDEETAAAMMGGNDKDDQFTTENKAEVKEAFGMYDDFEPQHEPQAEILYSDEIEYTTFDADNADHRKRLQNGTPVVLDPAICSDPKGDRTGIFINRSPSGHMGQVLRNCDGKQVNVHLSDIKSADITNNSVYEEYGINFDALMEDSDTKEKWGVFSKGGSVGGKKGKPVATFNNKEEATAKAKSLRKGLSPGEKGYYKMGYNVKKITEDVITEIKGGPFKTRAQAVKNARSEIGGGRDKVNYKITGSGDKWYWNENLNEDIAITQTSNPQAPENDTVTITGSGDSVDELAAMMQNAGLNTQGYQEYAPQGEVDAVDTGAPEGPAMGDMMGMMTDPAGDPNVISEPPREVQEMGANDDWGIGDRVLTNWDQDDAIAHEVISVVDDMSVIVKDEYGNKHTIAIADLRKAPIQEMGDDEEEIPDSRFGDRGHIDPWQADWGGDGPHSFDDWKNVEDEVQEMGDDSAERYKNDMAFGDEMSADSKERYKNDMAFGDEMKGQEASISRNDAGVRIHDRVQRQEMEREQHFDQNADRRFPKEGEMEENFDDELAALNDFGYGGDDGLGDADNDFDGDNTPDGLDMGQNYDFEIGEDELEEAGRDKQHANSPYEMLAKLDAIIKGTSGGLNKEKKMSPPAAGGDNPMTVHEAGHKGTYADKETADDGQCRSCKGTGNTEDGDICSNCDGKGSLKDKSDVKEGKAAYVRNPHDEGTDEYDDFEAQRDDAEENDAADRRERDLDENKLVNVHEDADSFFSLYKEFTIRSEKK